MERIKIDARPNWQAECERVGFNWHTLAPEVCADPMYWDETVAYKFSMPEIEKIEDATTVLYRMCLSAVEHVIKNDMLSKLSIPAEFHPLVKKSWEDQEVDIYGRFDFAFGPDGNPKMLEFNADTPTSLLEASVVQWIWMEDYAKRTGQSLDQFNSIHEALIETFKDAGEKLMTKGQKMYFSAVAEHAEDTGTVEYLRDCAIQAGVDTQYIAIEEIGWNGNVFTDLDEKPITTLFKIYPWEFLIREEFGKFMLRRPWDVMEPAWKLILSNKGILPILWELYEGHENLLPAYWRSTPLGGNYVEKPMLAREGADIKVVKNGVVVSQGETKGYSNLAQPIYQAHLDMPKFDGMTPVLGSWVVGGRAHGMGIREDKNEVTGNLSHFVPHFII